MSLWQSFSKSFKQSFGVGQAPGVSYACPLGDMSARECSLAATVSAFVLKSMRTFLNRMRRKIKTSRQTMQLQATRLLSGVLQLSSHSEPDRLGQMSWPQDLARCRKRLQPKLSRKRAQLALLSQALPVALSRLAVNSNSSSNLSS